MKKTSYALFSVTMRADLEDYRPVKFPKITSAVVLRKYKIPQWCRQYKTSPVRSSQMSNQVRLFIGPR